jgi:Domain of unknown function (DUF4340)
MMDFRRRNLMVLGAFALASVALAAVTLAMRARETASHFTPGEFLPGFAAGVKNATRIHIVSHDNAFDVTYSQDKGWVLPARGNYPANFEQVRHTLIDLATMETVEPKTARADWFTYIGLVTPPKGNGTAITVSDKSDHVLAAIIVGNTTDLANAQGATGVFVRHPGDNQSYLARAVYPFHPNLPDWLSTGVMLIESARLNTVTVTPLSGAGFTVKRDHPSDQQYKLDGPAPPKGMQANPAMVNLVPGLITDFAFVDVQPAAQVDFTKPVRLLAHTFDGQNIHFDAVAVKDATWIRISAEADKGTPTMQRQEADMINARAAQWAYKLSPEKGRLLTMTRDNLLTKTEAREGQPGLPPGLLGAPN